MDKKKALGLRLKEIRKRRGLSQEELAEKVDLEPPSICNIETGRNYPTFQNLEKILSVLNVSFIDIFKFEHHQETQNLIEEINKMLEKNPERIQDFYKIFKALTD